MDAVQTAHYMSVGQTEKEVMIMGGIYEESKVDDQTKVVDLWKVAVVVQPALGELGAKGFIDLIYKNKWYVKLDELQKRSLIYDEAQIILARIILYPQVIRRISFFERYIDIVLDQLDRGERKKEKQEANDERWFYGRFRNVKLTDDDYISLGKLGSITRRRCINLLDRKLKDGYREPRDHMRALTGWVLDAVRRDYPDETGTI